ncbi:MAG: protoporphyrinogen oxidase [Myxococcota bacterium]
MAWAGGSVPRLVVVGAGVAGLATARAALDARPDLDVCVLEREPRVGGLVETERTAEGFVVEHGADCLVTSKPAGLETARRVGLEDDVVTGEGAPRATFMAQQDALVPLPPGLAFGIPVTARQMLRTPVLSFAAKLRMALEPLVPLSEGDADESVAAFVERRFGRGFLDRVIEPLLGGIHGAPADVLSLQACLPRLRELERAYGSVVLGMRRQARERAMQGAAAPPVVSLRGGMASLPEALARSLGPRVRTGVGVRAAARHGADFRLALDDGGTLDADALVVAAPAHVAAGLVAPLSPALATLLGRVRHGRLDCVTFGWGPREVGHPLAGTGFLVPRGEGRPTRACSWSSTKWPGRAPKGSVLIRSVLDAPEADDDALVEAARRDLRDLMGIEAAPSLVRVRRRTHGLPIYAVGALERLREVREEAAELGAFAFAGNAHGGIGVPDCIQSGREAAAAVLGRIPA